MCLVHPSSDCHYYKKPLSGRFLFSIQLLIILLYIELQHWLVVVERSFQVYSGKFFIPTRLADLPTQRSRRYLSSTGPREKKIYLIFRLDDDCQDAFSFVGGDADAEGFGRFRCTLSVIPGAPSRSGGIPAWNTHPLSCLSWFFRLLVGLSHLCEVEFLHLEHGLHGPAGAFRILAVQQLGQAGGNDLPG
jgi:hypothetical protein